ncbi:hypothetical protein GE300_04255 [Rhodobacteraceae bacterium 2CG4]|uniref:AlgX/AlgJ SGNH hydrolase-like domain-containing protein n=1 Tax=Halovulum marinum TaxID=2662447 RepID=A0A6L5YYR9_9RHOB|nr:hypothetical protein [Halovulum marinum]MSU88834.1 hypothetical protein [Halovulum marinum]
MRLDCKALLLAAALLAPAVAGAQVRSAYGCEGLADAPQVASVEGRAGVFYRLIPDLQMEQPFPDEVVADVARLSRALAANGTRLVYVPVPPKGVGMPQYLPAEASDHGFDPEIAATVHDDLIRRLQDAGVAAVNLRRAFRALGPGGQAYFGTDPRLTAAGARAAARAIAAAIGDAVPDARRGDRRFVTVPAGSVDLRSHHRILLQRHCAATLPPVRTETFRTDAVEAAGSDPRREIFAERSESGHIALVGTEISAPPEVNLAGFLSEFTGMDVIQFSLPEGGAFGAISSYMTSRRFADARPAVLVWENPLQYNLAQFGDQPMRELLAAASDACRTPLAFRVAPGGRRLSADLAGLDPGRGYTLFLDADSDGIDRATFHLQTAAGRSRSRTVVRAPGQVRTGRFYVPADGLWAQPATAVEVDLPAPAGASVTLAACPYGAEG